MMRMCDLSPSNMVFFSYQIEKWFAKLKKICKMNRYIVLKLIGCVEEANFMLVTHVYESISII